MIDHNYKINFTTINSSRISKYYISIYKWFVQTYLHINQQDQEADHQDDQEADHQDDQEDDHQGDHRDDQEDDHRDDQEDDHQDDKKTLNYGH